MALKQPVGQKRLTNIAIVRLKKAGHRFEIACYKNKVSDWRNGIEKDLDEVLQTTSIFQNVGKGIMAKDKELKEAFGTTEERPICLEILQKGELQVSDKERKLEYDHLFQDVVGVLLDKCVNPDTLRPYTHGILERALREMHFAVDPKRSAKQQAMEALQLLRERFPIERARMRLRLTVPHSEEDAMEALLAQVGAVVDTSEVNAQGASAIIQVEPVVFRQLNSLLQTTLGGGRGRLEVLALAVTAAGETADEFGASALRSAALNAAIHSPPLPTAAPSPPIPQPPVPVPSVSEPDVEQLTPPSPAAPASAVPSTVSAPIPDPVVYPRGPITKLPEAHASRKERFAELDSLQAGWQVELVAKGSSVEAVFFSPSGERVGAFANARRMALQAAKHAAAAGGA